MKVKYDSDQDITLRLTEEEHRAILSGPTQNFYALHVASGNKILLKGTSRELRIFFFLGYSLESMLSGQELDNEMGTISIPNPMRSEDMFPWIINLSQKGIEHYKKGWPYGVRYEGSHKLFIFKGDDTENALARKT
jgi:hypothetical protein